MSSVVRAPAQVKDVRVFGPIMTPAYYDNTNGGNVLLIPFTCENGVLDINVQDGSQDMIDNGYMYSGTQGDNWRMVRQMGGERVASSLGPNFLTWIAAWLNDNYGDPVNDIQLVVSPVMTKVQQHVVLDEDSMLNSNYVLRITQNVAQTLTDNYVFNGNDGNNFYTAWVFKTPLTISYNYDGDQYYLTLQTMFQRPY